MDIETQIWYTRYVGVQMGTVFGGSHFLSLQSFRGFDSHLNQLHNGAPGMGNQPIPGEVLFFAGSENRQSTIPAVDY